MAASVAVAAVQAEGSEQCGAMPCRSNGAPYVTDKGAIVIFPGEQFVIAFKIENGNSSAFTRSSRNERRFRNGGGRLDV